MPRNSSRQSGVALLMTLGILALLSILGVAFSTSMRVMERTTRDFVYEMQTRYLAEGGIEYAIAELKEDARNNFVYNNNVVIDNQTGLLDGSGNIENITIKDSASKVNINYASKNLLATVINGVGLTLAQEIVNQRNGPDKAPGFASIDDDGDGVTDEADELGAEGSDDCPFLTPKSIGIVKDVYENNKDIITVWGYCDPNTQDSEGNNSPRSAINVHTADSGLIRLLAQAISGVTKNEAKTFANVIDGKEFHSWKEFEDEIGTLDDAEELMNNFNPNKHKPGWDSDDASTELCFHSSGTYEITATGKITKNNQILAKKTITTAVKIFGLWNQTTKEQFRQVWVNDQTVGDDISDGEMVMVTWLDNCPVISTDKWMLPSTSPSSDIKYSSSTEYYIIPNSIKLGYWDDFDEDRQFSIAEWVNGVSNITDHDGDDNWDIHLYWGWKAWLDGGRTVVTGEIIENNLINPKRWKFGNSSVTGWERDDQDLNEKREQVETWDDTGFFMFRYNNAAAEEYFYQNIDWTNADEPVGEYVDQIEVQLYPYPPTPNGKFNYDSDPYIQTKVYRAIQKGAELGLFIDSNLDGTFDRTFPISYQRIYNEGWMKFYGGWGCAGCRFDNLRIISDSGEYISIPSNIPSASSVEWGTLWSTVTLSESNAGNIYFSTSVDNFTNENEVVGNYASGIPIGTKGTSIQYKARFGCGDTDNYSKTPVLEDVWVTYLPKTKILYWKEGVEE